MDTLETIINWNPSLLEEGSIWNGIKKRGVYQTIQRSMEASKQKDARAFRDAVVKKNGMTPMIGKRGADLWSKPKRDYTDPDNTELTPYQKSALSTGRALRKGRKLSKKQQATLDDAAKWNVGEKEDPNWRYR